MAESTANGNFLGAATSESDKAAVTVEFSMLDGFEKKVGISQLDLVLEKWEASDKEQTKEEEQTVTPPAAEPSESKEWKPGSRCRAVYSVDGLVYPAVILWVKGQHCKVRFDDYNNEEEVDVSSLLAINELNGPGQTVKGSSRKSGFGSGSGSRRRRKETPDKEDWDWDQDGDRDKPRERGWRDDQQTALPWQSKERNLSQSRAEQDADEKKPTDKPSNQIFSRLPPPLSFQSSGDPTTLIPPPPLWACGGKEASTSLDPTWNLLMLWYMCGFHTGSYLAQQQLKSSSRD